MFLPGIREYWRQVREAEAAIIEDFPFVVSLEDPLRGVAGGGVSQVSREQAAKFITNATHRIATREEIVQFEDAQKRAKAEAHSREMKKQGIGVFVLPARLRK